MSNLSPISPIALYKEELENEKKRVANTGGLSDADFMLMIQIFKGNITAIAKKVECDPTLLRKRLNASESLKECLRIVKVNVSETLLELYTNAVVSGEIQCNVSTPVYNGDKLVDVKRKIKFQSIDPSARLWHLQNMVNRSAKNLGIQEKEEEEAPKIQNNIQINIIDNDKKEAFIKLLDIIDGNEPTIELQSIPIEPYTEGM